MTNGKEIEPFELPRLDWYDEEGRINKTALIQNFNAIEAKLNELSGVSAIGIITPDWNSIVIPDTTLESSDESVINLKSFIDIMNLKNFPLVIQFNGTRLVLLSYYNDDYKLINIRDVKLTGLGEDGKDWIYLNPETEEVFISDGTTDSANNIIIGKYFDGMVLHPEGIQINDINILEPLANMTERTKTVNSVTTNGNIIRHEMNGRLLGYTRRHDHTTSFSAVFRDQGY